MAKPDRRHKNLNWCLVAMDANNQIDNESVKMALLMDIRDELQALNKLLNCRNFTGFPLTLRQIQKNTAKPRRKVKK